MTVTKPTILHVIDTTGPGGAETVFIQLAKACQAEGYRSVALIRGSGWVEDQLKVNNVEYYILDCKGSFNVKYLWNLIKLVMKLNVKTIQSHLLGSNVYASMAGLVTGTKVISTFHGHVDISPNERFRSLKFSIIGLGSHKVVAVTKDLYKSILSMGNKRIARKAIVIANGIPLDDLSCLPIKSEDANYQIKSVKFGCLGNIRKAKNYFLAVDFIGQLLIQNIECQLFIAGDDTKKIAQELKQYVSEKKLTNHVSFLGFISNVPEFFKSIDIFLMTSSSEGHPLALTQALAAGVPILTTPSGVEEIVQNQKTAFLSEDHTVDSLCQSYQAIYSDGRLSSTVSVNGRLLAETEFDVNQMIKKYIKEYG